MKRGRGTGQNGNSSIRTDLKVAVTLALYMIPLINRFCCMADMGVQSLTIFGHGRVERGRKWIFRARASAHISVWRMTRTQMLFISLVGRLLLRHFSRSEIACGF